MDYVDLGHTANPKVRIDLAVETGTTQTRVLVCSYNPNPTEVVLSRWLYPITGGAGFGYQTDPTIQAFKITDSSTGSGSFRCLGTLQSEGDTMGSYLIEFKDGSFKIIKTVADITATAYYYT